MLLGFIREFFYIFLRFFKWFFQGLVLVIRLAFFPLEMSKNWNKGILQKSLTWIVSKISPWFSLGIPPESSSRIPFGNLPWIYSATRLWKIEISGIDLNHSNEFKGSFRSFSKNSIRNFFIDLKKNLSKGFFKTFSRDPFRT